MAVPILLLTLGAREANQLPWYLWVGAAMLIVLVMTVGYLMFRRDAREGEDISINPQRR
jgi:hypothetical protein